MQNIKQKIQDWIDNNTELDEIYELKDITIKIESTKRYLRFHVYIQKVESYLQVSKSYYLNIKTYKFQWSNVRLESQYYLDFLEVFRHKNVLVDTYYTRNELELDEVYYLQPEMIAIFIDDSIILKDYLPICKKFIIYMMNGLEMRNFPYKDIHHYEISLYFDTYHGMVEDIAINFNETNKLIVYIPEYINRHNPTIFSIVYLNLKHCKCHIELYYLHNKQIVDENHQLEKYYKSTNEYINSQNLHELHMQLKLSKNTAYIRHPLTDPYLCSIIHKFLHW